MILLSTLFVVLAIRSVANCIAIVVAIRDFELGGRRLRPTSLNSPASLVVILPVYKEAETIELAIEHLLSLCQSRDRIHLIVVGNARERDEKNANPTLTRAVRALQFRPHTQVVEAHDPQAARPGQLNYALQFVKTDPAKTWILTVDVDSRFAPRALDAFIEAINSGAHIIHQPALFLQNFKSLSFVQKGAALYQSRWTLAHEIKRIHLHNWTGVFISHLVGHGMAMQLQTLQRLGGFPETSALEDLHLGYYAAALGYKVRVIPSYERADTPETASEGFDQLFRWAYGVQQYPKFLLDFRRRFPSEWKQTRFRATCVAVHGVLSALAWNTATYILLAAAIGARLGNHQAALFIGTYFAEFCLCGAWFQYKREIRAPDLLMLPFYLVAELLRHSIPANWALLSVVLGRRHNLKKSEHHRHD